jgi:Putative adhesin
MTTDSREKLEHRFSVGANSELSVSNVSGRIGVTADDGSEIIVRHHKTGSSRSLENTQVEVHQDGNRVTVQTKSGPVGLINFGRASSVNYEITVPRDCSIRLHAVSADVDLRGSRAGAGIQTVSGKVGLCDIAGDITITTVSGDVVASELSGTLVARTTSGDGEFLTSRLRRFSVNTVSGDFTIDTPLITDEHCNAKTVSGDLELLLPADGGATIQLKSISGSVSCEVPAEIIKAGRRHWQGRVNGGGGNVDMNSVSGDLRIRRSRAGAHPFPQGGRSTDWSPIPPTPPEAPDAPAKPRGWGPTSEPEVGEVPPTHSEPQAASNDEETAAVLRALEQGEITVDEAMAKLS